MKYILPITTSVLFILAMFFAPVAFKSFQESYQLDHDQMKAPMLACLIVCFALLIGSVASWIKLLKD